MMTPEMQAKLKRSLTTHEGWKNFPYVDTVGKITIGCGYNLTDRGLPDTWVSDQYNKDVSFFYNWLCETFPWYLKLNADRQVALIDMSFMGTKHFLTFVNFIHDMQIGDYDAASNELLKSEWAAQVGERAITIASVIKNGNYDI